MLEWPNVNSYKTSVEISKTNAKTKDLSLWCIFGYKSRCESEVAAWSILRVQSLSVPDTKEAYLKHKRIRFHIINILMYDWALPKLVFDDEINYNV